MAKSLNRCTFIGNLGKDPEVRYGPSGAAVASVSLACSESWKDKTTGEKVEKTEWINVTAFGKLAEIFGKYLHKGAKVYIEGKFTTEKWQDKDGNDRYSTKIIANNLLMLSAPQGDQGGNQGPYQAAPQQQAPQQQAPQQQQMSGSDFDDDIPF